eukprot:6139909-Amphidinium_carterae.1
MYAAEKLKGDRAIVLKAVEQDGRALDYAAEELKGDRAIVLKAVEQTGIALMYAADALLLDSTFAPEAKKQGFILKISMLSGRYTCRFVTSGNAEELFTADNSNH